MSDTQPTTSVTDTVASTLRQAGSRASDLATTALGRTQEEVRAHRQEMLVLAATIGFVILVGVVGLLLLAG